MVDRVSPNARFLSDGGKAENTPQARIGGALGASMCTHVAGFLLIALVLSRVPAGQSTASPVPEKTPGIVWIAWPGLEGGGGSGNRTPEPPKMAKLRGKDSLTVPAVKPPKLDGEQPKDLPPPELSLTIPAITTAAADIQQIGIVLMLPTLPTESPGPGTGGAAGNGKGRGSGPGDGPGLNEGKNGGSGGGLFGDGAGVVSPRLIKEVKPGYTPDAMRAKVQGVVAMEAVVLPDGSVGRVEIIRSLDLNFGLDQEAVRTVKQWRFAPGTMSGQPVPVLVQIEMAFTLR